MLTDDQILPVCYYWAKRFCNKNVSFDELVNEAYVAVKLLESPLLVHKWVKGIMRNTAKGTTGNFALSRRKLIDTTSALAPELASDAFNNIIDESFSFSDFRDMQEELMKTIDKVCREDDKQLIYARFWLGMSYEEIAVLTGVVFQTVYFRVKKLLQKLRREYERQSKTQLHSSKQSN